MSFAAVFACSHRKGGNTDLAAELLAQGVREAGGRAGIFHVRDHRIEHCLACGACEKAHGNPAHKRCVLTPKDDSFALFESLLTARTVLFASPIYFYALPSRLKTLIDRSQQFWAARAEGAPWLTSLPDRWATVTLTAGRPTGERLFESAELTLKYFLRDYGISIGRSLHFRGKDGPGDLREDYEAHDRLLDAGRRAWEEAL